MQHHEKGSLIDGFRSYAAALVIEQGQQINEVARRLGIDARLLGRWIGIFCAGDKSAADELSTLRREVARLRSERDALFATLNISLSRETGHMPTENIASPPRTHGNPTSQHQTVLDQFKGRST